MNKLLLLGLIFISSCEQQEVMLPTYKAGELCTIKGTNKEVVVCDDAYVRNNNTWDFVPISYVDIFGIIHKEYVDANILEKIPE